MPETKAGRIGTLLMVLAVSIYTAINYINGKQSFCCCASQFSSF